MPRVPGQSLSALGVLWLAPASPTSHAALRRMWRARRGSLAGHRAESSTQGSGRGGCRYADQRRGVILIAVGLHGGSRAI